MKFIHLSDLHLGKRVNGFSMIEDQRFILKQILELVAEEAPQAVLIAGDVYDKSVPSEEAVELFDGFLNKLTELCQRVFILAGNHDSAERLAFGGSLFGKSGVHVSPVYHGEIEPVVLEDEFGPVSVWMLPFIKPAHIRRYWSDADVKTTDDAVKYALSACAVDQTVRNVLLAHQFVAGSVRCDSEELAVGGTDSVEVSAFDGFDYVALGHLHGPQKVGSETVRYAGSPLKYSFSEVRQNKTVAVVELKEKGDVSVRLLPLTPMRDLVELRGTYDHLILREVYEASGHQMDYVHITLTDETDIPHAAARLRVIYPYLMKLVYDNQRTRSAGVIQEPEALETLSPMELFAAFYQKQNNADLGEEQQQYLEGILRRIWEGMV